MDFRGNLQAHKWVQENSSYGIFWEKVEKHIIKWLGDGEQS